MRTLIVTLLFLFSLTIAMPQLSQAAGPNPGDPPACGTCPSSVTWPKLPLACLPARAERWEKESDMQPCHCPPQEKCPKVQALEGKDITFFLTWAPLGGGQQSCEFKGTDVPDIDNIIASGALFHGKQELVAAIGGTVNAKCGVDINNGAGNYWWFKLDVGIASNQNLMDWINDTLEMPVDLAVHCCDSICPTGLTPTFKDVEVEITRIVGEGTGTPKACEEATAALEKAQKELDDAKKAAEDAAKKAKAACEEPTGGPGAACNAALKDAKDADDLVKTKQTKVNDATNVKNKACDIPKTVKEKVMIKTITCNATQTYSREGCMIEGTQILMADGTTKKVEDVKIGDMVKGNEGAAKVLATSRFTQSEDFFYSINGGQATFTIEHPVLTKRGWKSLDPKITSTKTSTTKVVGKLEVGDKILTKDGEVEVKSIEKKKSEGTDVNAYNLKVERDGSFYANGVIIKGFEQMQMHY